MKYIVTFFSILFLVVGHAQTNETIRKLSGKHTIVYLRNDLLQRQFKLDSITDTITFSIPSSLYPYQELRLTTNGKVIWFKPQCGPADTNCLQFVVSTNQAGLYQFTFSDTTVINSSNARIKFNHRPNSSVAIDLFIKDNYWISICNPNNEFESMGINLDSKTGQSYFDTFICPGDEEVTSDCAPLIKNKFDRLYLPPCYDKDGNAISAKYHVIYDETKNPESVTYYEVAKDQGREYFRVLKSPLRPAAESEMIVSVFGKKKTAYTITTTEEQHFMEHSKDFQSSLAPISGDTNAGVIPPENIDPSSGNEKIVMAELLGVDHDLAKFNAFYANGEFLDELYQKELNCLIKNIAIHFKIPAPRNGDELAQFLSTYIQQKSIARVFYQELCFLLQSIRVRFDEAINKESDYALYSESVHVPNVDEFTIHVHKGTNTLLFERTFAVKGGFKIDFSTGLFFTGHNSGGFVASAETLRFRESIDTVFPGGIDTVLLTGSVLDTTITFIRQNKNITFGTGAYIHFYKRSGGPLNFGGSAGIIINNNAQVQLLAGLSLMMKAGKNRISLVGGGALGRVNILSIENQQYVLADNADEDGDGIIDFSNRLPRAYIGTNPATVEKWKPSWFAGITFNFDSNSGD